jgi:6-phosphogluconolactonase
LPHLKEDRISLTLPVINNARNVISLVLGAGKADIVKKIIKERSNIPASKVELKNGQLTYLLDNEAAQKLSFRDSYSHEGQAILYETGI